ncbi:MAG: 2-oxoacid:acceptor oxidoreductase family protein [Clostridia bacterium]|nr:2-oxoacid:acceptor oxidoreductase family protein [Clostridia bacterium]
MTTEILLAGFGGQGILFAGKQLAKTAMHNDKNVSWLPSYGPEMRGGSANCSVIISDREIGSPIIDRPDILIAFNLPSFYKFEPKIKEGGILIANSSLINETSARDDIKAYYIPATQLASDNGLEGGANVIILGYLLKLTGIFELDEFVDLMVAGIPATKAKLIENNKKAIMLGYNYEG